MYKNVMDQIRVFTQSSICIKGEKVLYFDPFQMGTAPRDADIVLITHSHSDHFSPADIEKVRKPGTVFVVPREMGQQAEAVLGKNVVTALPGEKLEVCGLTLETVAAYNTDKAFHPKERGWLGYVVTVNGARCFVAGDTDKNEENSRVHCQVALVPVGGTYTMNPAEAAELVNTLSPLFAVPTHYGTVIGSKEDGEAFKNLVNSGTQVVLKLQ